MLTLSELKILISALAAEELEYGSEPKRAALLERLREAAARLEAEYAR